MRQYLQILLFLLILNPLHADTDNDHDDDDDDHQNNQGGEDDHGKDKTFVEASKENLVSEIAEKLNVPLVNQELHFEKEHVEHLLEKLLFRTCTETSIFAKCNLCLDADDVDKWYNFGNGDLEDEDIQNIALGLVYALSDYTSLDGRPYSGICENYKTDLLNTAPSSLVYLFISQYGSAGQMTDGSFERLTKNINKTFGNSLSEHCFKTEENEEVFHDVQLKSDSDMKQASVFILIRLLGNGCLSSAVRQGTLIDIGEVIYNLDDLYLKRFGEGISNIPIDQTTCSRKEWDDIVRRFSAKKLVGKTDLNKFGESLLNVMDNHCDKGEEDHDEDEDHDDNGDKKQDDHEENTWEPWIAMLISNSVMSIVSLIGIMAFAGGKRKYFDHFILFLLSLGVSVLLCDAILHLIPHALDLHGHKEEDEDGHEGHDNKEGEAHSPWASDSYIWKCVAVLMGTYLFLLIQIILSVFGHGHSHGEQKGDHEMVSANGGFLANDDPSKENGVTEVDDHNQITPSPKFAIKNIQTAAWLILLGDGLHNFMDGIAIGGAFSEPFPAGLQGGVMTSIAILIHELPHEFADFALLVQTGLTVKQALVLNVLSSFTAFLGGVVGVVLGTKWNATPWILAVTGGLFLYISLSTMLPEVLNHPLFKKSKLVIVLIVFGFIIGFLILLFLAAYEDALISALKS